MTEQRVGPPVEFAMLEFPGSQFNGEIVPALAELVDDGIVAILDLVLVTKDDDGSVNVLEISELDGPSPGLFDDLDGEVTGLLSEDDFAAVSEGMSPNSSSLLIVWENSWARRLADAVTGSGGRLVAHERLDAEAVEAALAEASG